MQILDRMGFRVITFRGNRTAGSEAQDNPGRITVNAAGRTGD